MATLFVSAPGFAPARAELDLTAPEPFAEVTLSRTAVLVVRVVPPPDGSYYQLEPQRMDERSGEWGLPSELFGYRGLSWPNGPDGTFLLAGITPGRWRVLDRRSGIASSEVEVAPGDARVEVLLDLGGTAWVEGRVEAPDPAELAWARVLVLTDGEPAPPSKALPGEPLPGAHVSRGRFRVQVPSDREVTLRVWHPWLAPDPEAGEVRVRGARSGVVLRLVAGDELRLPLPELGSRVRELRIARYAAGAAPEGTPLEWHRAPLEGGVLRCGLPRGRWSLLVDPLRDFAPLLLRDVEIAGRTELPPPALDPGSRLVVRVLVPEDRDPPRIFVSAVRLDEPVYIRTVNSEGEARVVLTGLGPGRFRVLYGPVMASERDREEEVDVDGEHDVELELDLR